MARITAEEKAHKQEELNNIILDIFWNEGLHAVTYTEIAKRFGTTKSAIQRYFPSSDHFPLAWQGKIGPIMMEKLDWSSKEAFIDSWMEALSDKEDRRFFRIVEMLYANASTPSSSEQAKMGVNRFTQQINQAFGDESVSFEVFGRTFYYLLNN